MKDTTPSMTEKIPTLIDPQWHDLVRKTYKDYLDFKLVAQYPQLHNTISSPEFQVTDDSKTDPSVITIYKPTKDGSLRICILQNCRRKIDDEVLELREIIIKKAQSTLGHASGEKTYSYLQDYFYWPTMREDSIDYCRQCDTCQHTTYATQAPQGLA